MESAWAEFKNQSPADRASTVAKHWWWHLGQFCLGSACDDAVWWTHSFNDHLRIGRHFSLQCVIAAGPHREGNGRTLCLDCSFSELQLRIPIFWFLSKYLVYFHFYPNTPNCPSLAKPNLFQPRGTEQLLVKQKQYHHTAKCCKKELLEAILPLILVITESLTEWELANTSLSLLFSSPTPALGIMKFSLTPKLQG